MLEENWDAVQVFRFCQQSWIAGMGGAFALGFSAAEVFAGCRLAGFESPCFLLTSHVREMGDVAAKALNERKP